GLLRGVGRMDRRPVQGTKIIPLLAPGDDGIGVGGIAAAPREAGNALAEAGLEEKPMEGHAEDFGGCHRRSAFLRRREHRAEERGGAGCDRAARLVNDGGEGPRRPRRPTPPLPPLVLLLLAPPPPPP